MRRAVFFVFGLVRRNNIVGTSSGNIMRGVCDGLRVIKTGKSDSVRQTFSLHQLTDRITALKRRQAIKTSFIA
ncbi:hypothetical protein FBY13_107186 [Pantoea sp. SJZ147]|nr:hypothetical protein FBY13_107186 [Pantoea sp. SJZ147]